VAAILVVVAFSAVSFTLQTSREGDVQVVSYYQTGDARRIVVSAGIGLGDDIVGSSRVEDARSVGVTVRARHNPGTYPAILIFMPAVVLLRSALVDRTVLDASGKPLRDLGYYRAIPTPTRSRAQSSLRPDGRR
jgi:hypothetical protein